MAHSPEENAATSEIIRYDQGWNAINAMLRAGRSLSGHERNCCFLNSRGERFADVSAVVGLDFDDDGRVLSLADWDYDGDIDFWIANRSGPAVRYLENRVSKDRSFVALRLEGVNCNRDAIGAKVRVTCTVNNQPTMQTQTLKAGEGYLAQNSKWLHFGLGAAEKVDRLEVQWPNGEKQEIGSLQIGKWYRIRQGSTEPQVWAPPTQRKLTASGFTAPAVSDAARIVLLSPIPTPAINSLVDGESISITGVADKPRLLNLWATWCQPCLKELAHWKQHSQEISEAGIEIVAINVDEVDANRQTKVDSILNSLELPFKTTNGSKEIVEQFDVLQRSLLSRQRPLPIPSSFLIDSEGRLRVVYKGPVEARQLLADAALLKSNREETLAAAIPFQGRWLQPPGGSTPLNVVVKYLEGGLKLEAQQYIESLIAQQGTHPEYVSASIMNLYGATLLEKKRYEEAKNAFEQSLLLDPKDRQAHIELGTLKLRIGHGAEATTHFEEVLRVTPSDPELLFKLGMSQLSTGDVEAAKATLSRSAELRPNSNVYWQLGNIATQTQQAVAAITAYENAIQLRPDLVYVANNLAWLLATSKNADVRNGKRALEVAELINNRSQNDASAIDTLAAALAEVGDFAGAVKTAERAERIAKKSGNNDLVTRINARKELYRAGNAFREAF